MCGVGQLERLLSSPVGYVTDFLYHLVVNLIRRKRTLRLKFFFTTMSVYLNCFETCRKNISSGRVETFYWMNESFVYSYNIFQFLCYSKWSLIRITRTLGSDTTQIRWWICSKNLSMMHEGSAVRSGGESSRWRLSFARKRADSPQREEATHNSVDDVAR